MKPHRHLRTARAALYYAYNTVEQQHEDYICFGLEDFMYETNSEARIYVCYALKAWIHDLLDTYNDLGDWIRNQIPYGKRRPSTAELRETRLSWIEWMLAQDLSEVLYQYEAEHATYN